MTENFVYCLEDLLDEFQEAFYDKKYTDKVPYDRWRELKRLAKQHSLVFIEFSSQIVNIRANGELVYWDKVYDYGFGRFLYDKFKKKETEDMALNSKVEATFTCNTADIDRNVLNQLAGVPILTTYTESTADATALDAKADYMSYSDCDSATGAASATNYYTATDHSIKINGSPLTSDSIYVNKDESNSIWGTTGTAMTNIITISDRVDTLESQIEQLMSKNNKEYKNNKENDNMMKGFNFDFGPCGNTVRLSMYGLAVQNVSGEWVSYNTTTKEIVNVDIINMADGGKYIYKMPVAISEVQVGDIIVHAKVPMFVTGINNDGSFNAIDVRAGEAKCILATRSPFGFNFVTKVVNLFGNMLGTPTADQPFGNMLPFLMLNGENKDIDPMMMFFLMGQNGNTSINPMMWYFLSKDNKNMDPAMMWMVMSMAGGNAPGFMAQPHTCKCHQKVSDEQI